MVKRLQGVGIDGVFREDRITSDEDDDDDDDDDDDVEEEEEEEEEEAALADQQGQSYEQVNQTNAAIGGIMASNLDATRMDMGP